MSRTLLHAGLSAARGRLALVLLLSAEAAHAQGPPAPDPPASPPPATASFPEAQGTEPPSDGAPPAVAPAPAGEGVADSPATTAAPATAAPATPLPPPESELLPVSQEHPDASDEHAMPHGALLFSAGFAPITVYRVAAGSSESVREGEGSSMSSGTLSIHYHYPVVPFFSARGFFRMGGFETDLSVGGGYGAHTLYMLGVAPALSFAVLPRKSQSVHLVLSLPVGLVIGTQASPPRDAVEEDINVGVGYRIGGAFGLLIAATRRVGFTMDLEIARDDLYHRVTYRALDGRSPTRDLNLRYTLWSADMTVGVVWVL